MMGTASVLEIPYYYVMPMSQRVWYLTMMIDIEDE
jgi:hypothetical protein